MGGFEEWQCLVEGCVAAFVDGELMLAFGDEASPAWVAFVGAEVEFAKVQGEIVGLFAKFFALRGFHGRGKAA